MNTAFNADGSLRDSYMERVRRVIRAADEQGAVIILSCFYQRQHSHAFAFNGKLAIVRAVSEVAAWIHRNRFTNVVVEVSNEFAHGGYRQWKAGDWLRSVAGQVQLIQAIKTKAPDLLVSTSGMGSGVVPQPIAEAADFILLHFNRTPLNQYAQKIAEARRYGKPVLCNEDDKTGTIGATAARLSIRAGAGWGFMHVRKNQTVPFQFDGARDDTVVYDMLSNLTKAGASPADAVDDPPFIVVTSPVDGDVFSGGKNITLRASVTGVDTDGLALNFYAGKAKIAERSAPPWEATWKNPPPGNYNVVAVLRDANGSELLRSDAADFEVRP